MKNNVISKIVDSIVKEGSTIVLSGWHTDAWKITNK